MNYGTAMSSSSGQDESSQDQIEPQLTAGSSSSTVRTSWRWSLPGQGTLAPCMTQAEWLGAIAKYNRQEGSFVREDPVYVYTYRSRETQASQTYFQVGPATKRRSASRHFRLEQGSSRSGTTLTSAKFHAMHLSEETNPSAA